MKEYSNTGITNSIRISTILIGFCLLASTSTAAVLNIPQEWFKREHNYSVTENFSKFEVEYKGKILVSDNDKDIASISPGGYLKISKSSFGNSRVIEISSDSDGKLTKLYFDGSKKDSYDSYGRDWLSEILPDVIHKTGIGGKERALRIYKQSGVEGVISEFENIEDSWFSGSFSINFFFTNSVKINNGVNVRNLYLKVLIDEVNLQKDELISVLRAMKDIQSNSTKGTMLRIILDKYVLDSYLMDKFLTTTATLSYNTERGNVLRKFQSKYKINSENSDGYFNVISSMEINSEKGNVLKPLLLNQKLDDDVMVELLREVKNFSSESEKAAVLRLAIPRISGSNQVNNALLSAINSMGDSYRYLHEELVTMLANGDSQSSNISKVGMIAMMDMAMDYEGNTRRTIALRKLHSSLTNDPEIIEKYFDVVRSMNNEMERYNVLLDLIYSRKLTKEWLTQIYDITKDVASEDYKQAATAILRATIPYVQEDESLMKEFFAVLEKVDQDSGKEEIIRTFCEKGAISNKLAVYLFKMVEDIEVDIETATSLQYISKAMPKDSNLEFIYSSVANKMESDYEYERAMLKR